MAELEVHLPEQSPKVASSVERFFYTNSGSLFHITSQPICEAEWIEQVPMADNRMVHASHMRLDVVKRQTHDEWLAKEGDMLNTSLKIA